MERRGTIWPGRRLGADAKSTVGIKRAATEAIDSAAPATPSRAFSVRSENGAVTLRPPVTRFSGGALRTLSLLGDSIRKIEADPWEHEFTEMMRVQEWCEMVIAYDTQYPEKIVAVREMRGVKKDLFLRLRPVPAEHFLPFRSAFLFNETVYLIYDIASVSIRKVISTPCGPLWPEDMAQICLNVLQGLKWMHEVLQIPHGQINATTVVLAGNGAVKISLAGDAMLMPLPKASVQADLCSVRDLVRMMVECTTEPSSPFVEEKFEYHPLAANFVRQNLDETCDIVLKHPFLQLARGSGWLAPYVWVADALQTKEMNSISSLCN